MTEIPRDLVKSLTKLGLLESEAKLYIALAMMNSAEVKRLINFLGLSKPNTYESLRLLEEKGLVVLINSRPMTYQATPPEIGLNILFETHLNAKKQAEELFKTLDKEKFTKKSKTLWFILSEKSVDYKIKEMIKSARKSIFMAAPPEYLKYFKKFDGTDLKIDFIIFSDDKKTEHKLKKFFENKEGNFWTISKDKMINKFSARFTDEEELKKVYKEAYQEFGIQNLMLLLVDDFEMLYVISESEESYTAINTRNKALLSISKIGFMDILPLDEKYVDNRG